MTRRQRYLQSFVAAGLGVITYSIATKLLIDAADVFASGLLFIALGTLVSLVACAVTY